MIVETLATKPTVPVLSVNSDAIQVIAFRRASDVTQILIALTLLTKWDAQNQTVLRSKVSSTHSSQMKFH